MTVFDLGRMRHPDLLALYFWLNPNSRERDARAVAAMPTGHLVRVVVTSPGITRT